MPAASCSFQATWEKQLLPVLVRAREPGRCPESHCVASLLSPGVCICSLLHPLATDPWPREIPARVTAQGPRAAEPLDRERTVLREHSPRIAAPPGREGHRSLTEDLGFSLLGHVATPRV